MWVFAKHVVWALSALGLAMTAGGGAAGQVAAPADQPPDWLKKPNAADLMMVWPTEAWKRGLGGKAVIGCRVSAQGSLFDCVVVSESPEGVGFGNAALALSSQFLMKPAIRAGKPVAGSVVRIPISFVAPDAATGSYIPGPSPRDPTPIRVASNILWVSAPSYAEVLAGYPAKARAAGMGGRVVLDCSFNAKARLKTCEVLNEEPRGYGFAAAALALKTRFEGPASPAGDESLFNAHTQVSITFASEMLAAKSAVIGKPKWTELPAGQEFERRLAPLARAAGVTSVRAVLNCTVRASGSLGDCTVASEDPAGAGIGPAALELAPAFRLSIWTPEGLPVVGGVVQVPLRYKVPVPALAKP